MRIIMGRLALFSFQLSSDGTSVAMNLQLKNLIALILIIVVGLTTTWVVHRFHKPGHLDVIAAQAMDMSRMRPPMGAAPVELASIRTGSLDDSVTYSGSVLAYNEQDISPRITGMILSLPVYPGDQVQAGEVVAQLDSAEVSAKTQEADADASEADINEQVAHITHHLHHGAALAQAQSVLDASKQGVMTAVAQANADQDEIVDAEAGVQSAQANADYWKTEIEREKQLTGAGAASQQEYQDEQAQAQGAFDALSQAQAKVSEAKATLQAAQASVSQAQKQVDVGSAGVRMALADIVVAQGLADQAGAAAQAAQASANEANIVQGYTRITSPASGVVIARPIAPGTLVQPGQVILQVAEIDTVRVQANVAISDLDGIHPGSSVEITPDDGGSIISAKVTSVFPSANMDTRTAVVEADIPNPGHRLLPGAFVSMQITKHVGTNKLLVPVSSVVSQDGQSYVWIANQPGSGGQEYVCVICHIHYTAAQAMKFHYIDPMDGGKLIPLKASESPAPTGLITAHEVHVQAGGSDGTWTEVTSDDLTPGDHIVAQGVAGLTEGARIVATTWGSDGPTSLPNATSANGGLTVYRCEICGMTYSAADAKKDHYVDPMDGGKLVPVQTGGAS
jgi:multidrug efflux pump subunit AcrA (membrane-fusion protein)